MLWILWKCFTFHFICVCFIFNCILPDVLMLSLMLIVIPVCVHFIFMLFLPCINIHLTKITQLISGNVHGEFFPLPTMAQHLPFSASHIRLLFSFSSDVFWSPLNTFHMVTGHGGMAEYLRAPRHQQPISCIPPAPLNHFQKFLLAVCSTSERRLNTCSPRMYFSTLPEFLFCVFGFRCSFPSRNSMLKFQLRFENSVVSGVSLRGNHIFPVNRWDAQMGDGQVCSESLGLPGHWHCWNQNPVWGEQGLN